MTCSLNSEAEQQLISLGPEKNWVRLCAGNHDFLISSYLFKLIDNLTGLNRSMFTTLPFAFGAELLLAPNFPQPHISHNKTHEKFGISGAQELNEFYPR